ncbi:MAG TPA: M23 family metallopeptidase [Stellaceae bacterium]|nr:M23 family metallopeptidase [Stellaceae bacterium]
MATCAKWTIIAAFLSPVVFFAGKSLADGDSSNVDQTTSELERLIASTGIDPQSLLNQGGEGGPYIALDEAIHHGAEARTGELREIVKILPFAAPLDDYGIRSGFGARVDPLTGKRAFHPGVDLTAPYRTPVYSTAPGVVAFAGVRGSYGKTVEIDHGHGIVTRFAHLHRISVAPGQAVGVHVKIGELGSTGRSTGPHLHYEVLVNDDPLDPEKFLQAGAGAITAPSRDSVITPASGMQR